ncbi:MAG: ATP synthase F1 subunit epsilon [Oligoflexia bacterium]|nr:ATP synthase F1 subunit epsilon [Oligoflexia bacterium]
MALQLTILSPEKRLLESGEAEEVTLTTGEGLIQVLPGHAAMVGTLETGTFSYRTPGGQTLSGFISTGFFEVRDDKISLLAETVETRGDIDLERARRAQARAEDVLKQIDLDEARLQKYRRKLERAMIRQKLAE